MNSGLLRYRLKRDTQARHAAVEQLASRLDLTLARDLSLFLAAHKYAYDSLVTSNDQYKNILEQRQSCIIKDLQILGHDYPPPRMQTTVQSQNNLGHLYVITGAHLGAKVLARQWEKSRDPRVLKAKHFMADTSLAEPWKMFNIQISAIPADGAKADAIVNSANQCFDLFQSAFTQVMTQKESAHVL